MDLIRVAREVVEAEGPAALSFRAAAKAVGLSAMAPYRHFADGPRELLAAVAEEGFHELIAFLQAGAALDPRERVVELVLRYVQFGVERPNLYRALFHEQLADPLAFYAEWEASGDIGASTARRYQTLDAIKLEAFGLIVRTIGEAQRASAIGKGDAEDYALAMAALAHGLVGEFIDEGLFRRSSSAIAWSEERQDMSRRVVELLVAGFVETPAD